MVPYLPLLNQEDMRARGENIDPPEEIEVGKPDVCTTHHFLAEACQQYGSGEKDQECFQAARFVGFFICLDKITPDAPASTGMLRSSNRHPFISDTHQWF